MCVPHKRINLMDQFFFPDQQQKEPLPVFPATSIFPTMEDDSHVNVAPKSSQAHFDNQSGNVAHPGNDDSGISFIISFLCLVILHMNVLGEFMCGSCNKYFVPHKRINLMDQFFFQMTNRKILFLCCLQQVFFPQRKMILTLMLLKNHLRFFSAMQQEQSVSNEATQ